MLFKGAVILVFIGLGIIGYVFIQQIRKENKVLGAWSFQLPSTEGVEGDVISTEPTEDELRIAALRGLGNPDYGSSLYPRSEAFLNNQQQWIDRTRQWVSTLTDKRVASAYIGWLDFYQNKLNENREENRTHVRQKEEEARRIQRKKECARVRDIEIPTPPR